MLVSALDGWNDGESDAEYCNRLFGENLDNLIPDDYVSVNNHKIFYLLWSPLLEHLKIGKADDEKNLLLRLQERRRQCGDTKILGIKYLSEPTQEEKWWKATLKAEWIGTDDKSINPQIAMEVFDFGFIDYPLSYISTLAKQRGVYVNIEALESLVKEVLDWHGYPDNIPSLFDLI